MKIVLVSLGLALLLAACNTMEGLGQDVKGAGEWTSESAQKVKNKM